MASTSVLSLSLMGGTAFAQLEPTANDIDEIIVTGARGRVENALEVPIATTIFDAEDLQDARVDQVDDFFALTPGVTFANSQDAGTNFISIRGSSQVRNGEAPVAILIDGVLQTTSRTFDQPLFDLENVEILRGPQGALYGRNASGGAIIINTKGPTDEFEGYVKGTIGEGEEFAIEGSVAGPIIEDTLGYRVSARYLDREGYFDNVILDENVDSVEDFAIRGHLSYTPNEWFTADIRGNLVRTDAGSLNFTYQPAVIDPVTGIPDGIDPAAGDLDFDDFVGLDFGAVDADNVDRDFFANNLGQDSRDFEQISARLNFDLGFADLLLTGAYDNLDQRSGGDQFPYSFAQNIRIFGGLGDGLQSQTTLIETYSGEVRLKSKSEQDFRWDVGAYIVDTSEFRADGISLDENNGLVFTARDPLEFDDVGELQSFIASDNDNLAWAVFFNFNYDVTDRLEIGFAGRYDEDERSQVVDPLQGTYANGALTGVIGVPGAENEETFDLFQPKATIRYNVTDDISVFGSWGRGFRSGQFNQNGIGELAAAAGVDGAQDVLDQEETETFELGAKADFLNGRVTSALTLFDTDIENAPFFVFVGEVGAQILVGIDEVDVQGAEFEIAANLFEGFDAYFGASITDAEIATFSTNPTFAGNEAPYIADSTINVGGQYKFPITDTLGIFLRGDYERRGEQFWDAENTTSRSAIDLVNVRAGIEDNDGRWSLTISGDNIFDEVYNSEFVQNGFAHAGTPSVWRADLRYNF